MENEEQQKYSKVPPQLLPHVYKKGQSGNPHGRPVGAVSMKQYVKNKLATMTEEEREEFLEGVDKKILWEMAEGKAEAKADITTNGESINPVLIKFIDANNRDTSGVQETL